MDGVHSTWFARQQFNQTWLGNVIGLRRLSLQFRSSGEESGFLMHYNKTLRVAWRVVLAAYVLVFGYWALIISPDVFAGSGPQQLISGITFALVAVGIILALVQVALISMPRVLRHLSLGAQEMGVVAMTLYTQLCVFGRPYVARLLGYADPAALFPDVANAKDSDSFFLLSFCMILMVSHVCLPLRWCALVTTEATTVLMYGVMCYGLDSPEPQKNICFVYLLILVVLIAIGRRQSEVNDRLIFSSLLSEKSLRVQAEYKLSQAKDASPGNHEASEAGGNDEVASYAPTTSTGELFTGLEPGDGGVRPALETILEIGKKEQWVIDCEEVTADPGECLGSGGFGVVIAGKFHGSPVALKFHRWIGNARPLADIGNELRLLRKLRHPNIVLLHGACLDVERKDLVVVMEHVCGEPMSDFVARAPAAGDRCKALADVCLALMYLHSRSPAIVHGDLKPDNVMVERRGPGVHAKLLDFGLARLVTRSAKPGGGTYRWMAPGVLSPGGGRLDVRDDVFTVGLLIFFAATGQKPFEGLGDRFLKTRAYSSSGAHPTLVWPMERSELMVKSRPVVEECLQQQCKDRPAVAAVHEMLRAFDRQGCDAQIPEAAPSNLWRAVFEMRRSAFNTPRKHAKKGDVPAHRSEGGDSDVTGGLTPVKEDEIEHDAAVPPPEALASLRFPSLRPTPKASMRTDVFDAAVIWNFPVKATACCDFHATVDFVESLCADMRSTSCRRIRLGKLDILQCPSCHRLRYDDGAGAKEMECDVCGYTGPAVAPAQSSRS